MKGRKKPLSKRRPPAISAIDAAITAIEEGLSAGEVPKLLESNDAMLWAETFIAVQKRHNVDIGDIDVECMLGWFANAMFAQELANDRLEREKYEKLIQKVVSGEGGITIQLDKD